MNNKTECYALEMNKKTYDALEILTALISCLIKFDDGYTYITAKEKDFAFIEDVLVAFV